VFAKHHLQSFTDAFSKRRFRSSTVRGLRAIPIAKVIGSVNRSQDYYYDFTKISEGDRTREIERMMSRGESLPAIDVFQIGDYYYVEDGHHRVAIAKKLKQEFIDAYVTQYFFWSYEDYFHEKLGFSDIQCSSPLYYKRLLDDIRDLRESRYGEKYVDFGAVAREWYEEVYRPAMASIEASGIMSLKPRAPGDYYCRYLRLRHQSRFSGQPSAQILNYMVRRYQSPLYMLERVGHALLRGVVRLSRRIAGRSPMDGVNPSA